MKIKIPKEFKIGARSGIVAYQEYLRIDEGFDGTYNKRTEELKIDSQIGGRERDRVFGHELMEVIKANYELKTSEEDMSCIAKGWLEFLWQLGIEFDWSDIKESK